MPEHKGVDVQHPTIVNAIENLAKQGKSTEEIVRIVGMPHEVVESHKRRVEQRRGPGRPRKDASD